MGPIVVAYLRYFKMEDHTIRKCPSSPFYKTLFRFRSMSGYFWQSKFRKWVRVIQISNLASKIKNSTNSFNHMIFFLIVKNHFFVWRQILNLTHSEISQLFGHGLKNWLIRGTLSYNMQKSLRISFSFPKDDFRFKWAEKSYFIIEFKS